METRQFTDDSAPGWLILDVGVIERGPVIVGEQSAVARVYRERHDDVVGCQVSHGDSTTRRAFIREYGCNDMVTHMKTTIEFPDDLAREAKEVANSSGTTLRDLVVSGLRSEVSRRRDIPRVDFAFPTQDGEGMVDGLSPSDAISRGYGLPE